MELSLVPPTMTSPSWHFVAPLQYYEDHGSLFSPPSTLSSPHHPSYQSPATTPQLSARPFWETFATHKPSPSTTSSPPYGLTSPGDYGCVARRKRGCYHGRDAQSEGPTELVVELWKLYGHFRDMMGGLRRDWFVPQRLRDEMWV